MLPMGTLRFHHQACAFVIERPAIGQENAVRWSTDTSVTRQAVTCRDEDGESYDDPP